MSRREAQKRFKYELREEGNNFQKMANPNSMRAPADALIGDLRKGILKKNPSLLRDRDAAMLDVYRPGSSIKDWLKEEAAERARNRVTEALTAAHGTPNEVLVIIARQPRLTVHSQGRC